MRLAAQAKAGFYPTPEPVYQIIAKYLSCPSGKGVARLLDPCCGTGEPLNHLAEALSSADTYGIELDSNRHAKASAQITHCLLTDYQNTRISNQAFSLLYLNPPYDDDTGAQRQELSFLKSTIKYLAPLGILVYIIPQARISKRIASVLAYHFNNIAVMRFPDALYGAFKQTVIIGVLKKAPSRDSAVEQWLTKCGTGEAILKDIQTAWLHQAYAVPRLPTRKILFATNAINPEDLLQETVQHGIFKDIRDKLWPPHTGSRIKPIMPMRFGHLAQALASGYMNGIVRDKHNQHPLLVKGSTTKVTDTREESDQYGTKIIETERVKIVVKAITLTGELLTIE